MDTSAQRNMKIHPREVTKLPLVLGLLGGDGIPAELFQILKDDAVNVLHSICQQTGKLSSGHRTGKGQFSFQSQRKVMPEDVPSTAQLHSSHILAK